jgi:spermidine synthase
MSEEIDGRAGRPAWDWIALGLALATCATLLLEIVITRIFSVILIYHFAFMAICLALFGLGLAGIFVYLYPELFRRRRLSLTTAKLALLFAASTLAALVLFHLFVSRTTEWPLALGSVLWIFAIMVVPFFLSGLTVAVPISRCPERIGFLYGADLTGAAVGAIVAIPLLAWLGGPMAVAASAVLASLAAICFATAAGRRSWQVASSVLALVCVVGVPWAASRNLLELRHSRAGPEEQLLFQQWNSFSRVSVWGPYYFGSWWRLGAGAPRPGRSPGTQAVAPTHLAVVIDGGAKTPLTRFQGDLRPLEYFMYDITSLGYQVRPARTAMILGAGGGRDILTARAFGVEAIQAIEINPLIVDITRRRFRDFSGSPYDLPGVGVAVSDGRSFAASSRETFDIVQLAAVDTLAASGAGALALVEHSLYTLEAFGDYHDRLSSDGILSITHLWGIESPERALRSVDLVRRAWESRGHPEPSRHIVVIGREFGWGTLLASRRPFAPEEIVRLERLAESLGFGFLYAPGRSDALPGIVEILGPAPERFLRQYPLDVVAPTDDRPFFFFFEKPIAFLLGDLLGVVKGTGPEEHVEAEVFRDRDSAPTVLVRLALWMLGLSIVLIFLLPMGLGRLRLAAARGAGRNLVYFACIGLGFIMVEISMIQRFTLFLGQPIYAFAVILGCLLVSGGLGSLLSSRLGDASLVARSRLILTLVVVGAILHAVLAPTLIGMGLRWSLPWRLTATVLAIAPLGLVMGMPLPLGIRLLERRQPAAIAWGWGINGSLSVMGTILAMMVAVIFGITWAILAGAGAYALALWMPTDRQLDP